MVDDRLLSGVEVLVAVIETGSFVRAAEALGLSDSGVSRAVARVEARLGVRLLQRTTRSLRLTDEGGRFYAEAAPLLAQGARKTTTVAARSAASVCLKANGTRLTRHSTLCRTSGAKQKIAMF
jgi:DNA-binding transcriptional LysR family regulator